MVSPSTSVPSLHGVGLALIVARVCRACRSGQAAFRFFLANFPLVADTRGFEVMMARNLELTNEVLRRAQRRDDLYFGVLGDVDVAEEKKEEEPLGKEPFPFMLVGILLSLIILFVAIGDRNTAMSNFMPFINLIGMLGFGGYVVWGLRS